MQAPQTSVHFHRGRLSKACRRCRDRRLKCDLQKPSCSSCIRAQIQCTGYRDTGAIRINDQTDIVQSKASAQIEQAYTRRSGRQSTLSHLPQDLQVLGRDMFFAWYVADFSRAWEFLYAYQGSKVAPKHLALVIDAVSLAFLSHQVSSQSARDLGWRRYGTALKTFNAALQDPDTARKPSTFESALLLDLFDKIMSPNTDSGAANYAHVQGALALVKLRGLENFRTGAELRALTGLECNATIYAISTGNPVPEDVRQIRNHVAQFVDTSYPKWKLSEVILEVIATEGEMLRLRSSPSSMHMKCTELDKRLEKIGLEAERAWTYQRKFVSGHDPRILVPDGFFPLYDVYPNRTITQMWNVLRLTRILLCEQVIDGLSGMDDDNVGPERERAEIAIVAMIREILASVPQMTNCDFAARHKLPEGSLPGQRHTHTMSHLLDVYILIYPLYVVAWSRHCPTAARDFIVNQLRHISEHFGIKEGYAVLEIIEKQELGGAVSLWPQKSRGDDVDDELRTDIPQPHQSRTDPWLVYRLLGSYAFAAT